MGLGAVSGSDLGSGSGSGAGPGSGSRPGPDRVLLLSDVSGRPGGPAAWARGLVDALCRAEVEAELVPATDPASVRLVRGHAGPSTVVHTYSQSPASLMLARIGRRAGSPVVHTVHGDFSAEQASKRGLKRLLWLPLNRDAVALAHAVTVPSAYLADRLTASVMPGAPKRARGRLRATGGRIDPVVIPNGVDCPLLAGIRPADRAELAVPAGAFLVAAVTPFTHPAKVQGLVHLCRAVAGLRARGKPVELIVAGSGRLLDGVRAECPGDGVRFVGNVPDGAELIAAADVFVHSSGLDVSPYVVLEALAVGTPAIVTPVGGVPELVGDAATLVGLGDVDGLADAIAELMAQPDRRAELSRLGRERARAFDWPVLVEQRWIPFYETLIRRGDPMP